jgi:hypothetical protein
VAGVDVFLWEGVYIAISCGRIVNRRSDANTFLIFIGPLNWIV